MQNTIAIPESIYRRTEQAAQARGISVDALVSDVLDRELADDSRPVQTGERLNFPVMSSREPESMDLANFNFDDLLT
jgi:hypothetical protein